MNKCNFRSLFKLCINKALSMHHRQYGTFPSLLSLQPLSYMPHDELQDLFSLPYGLNCAKMVHSHFLNRNILVSISSLLFSQQINRLVRKWVNHLHVLIMNTFSTIPIRKGPFQRANSCLILILSNFFQIVLHVLLLNLSSIRDAN